MTTERLYYTDCYLREFRARVVEASPDGRRVYLDRTAFYPTSGGQPHDTGWIEAVPVTEVVDEGERIAHLMEAPVERDEVACRIDWGRRFDHMQQHTGQHVLSAVLVERFGIPTVSFHLGRDISTIDVAVGSLEPEQVREVERRANEVVMENRPVRITFETPEQASDLRRPSEREGVLRVVTIEGLDRSACGGTHVRATGEVGPVLIRKLDRMRGNVRIEFLCGMRAVRRARADFEALARIARLFSAPLDEAPALVEALREKLEAEHKARRKLAAELAERQGRELYQATAPDAAGLRRAVQRLPSGAVDDELRALARGFTSLPKALFVALVEEPSAVLLAVSADAGLHAGETLRAALAAVGGRGGGNERIAQGSVPNQAALEKLAEQLLS
ncbi:MAG: DHHA1 domain-containing protein [Bryobacterales bacterium]|nr:DHHA1 domain-containing protein [Bryobacteraceae bacterium]MDW8353885.1 DHHA1 domain-containing protein [Bryobacterales bacterium]